MASGDGQDRSVHVAGSRQHLLNLVNSFFNEKLNGMPEIKHYMENLA